MKLLDARRDHYRRLAREQGYRSRAAYKLKELNKSYRIIGPGFYVLDLGCAPGGWTQIAVRLAGNRGRVMGVDAAYVEEIPGAGLLRADVEDEFLADDIMDYFGRRINAVICDMSPSVTGNWTVDHARQISLNYSCSKIMDKVLASGGNAVFKVFDGDYSEEFRRYMDGKFSRTKITKPKASRKPSSELYLVCMGFRR
jgi:23S rRNA (uridine2552-2'-O)-methyltransferase